MKREYALVYIDPIGRTTCLTNVTSAGLATLGLVRFDSVGVDVPVAEALAAPFYLDMLASIVFLSDSLSIMSGTYLCQQDHNRASCSN